ncbi:MAG: GNAT family N-acetyltransferase [Bacteroidetes bacterium]|nr:GNAT family N-acetyltransferase [Bacteroidota bacterium]MBS1930703.1 GNAT family N-acetyltransferase [Bacteroidota bacterium]
MTLLTIREATRKDAELIADLSRQTFYETFAPDNRKEDMDQFMNEVFSKQELMKEPGSKNNIFLLAFAEDRPAGYVRMRKFNNPPSLGNDPAMEIARLYAIKEFIGKGVGAALMQQCIDISVNLKMKFIWLGVWEKNHRAISFYEKWGFEKFGETEFILGSDIQTDWLMRKKLF